MILRFLIIGLTISSIECSLIKPKNDDLFELLILHNNDMHARFEQTNKFSATCSENDKKANKCYGGFARVANKVREARKKAEDGNGPPVLYLNAGDTYTGTIWFAVHRWRIAAAFINALQPDAVSLGNHEFDDGVSGLTPFVHNLSCPILCANINVSAEIDLEKETNLKKSVVLNVKGVSIGIVGYLTPDTQHLAKPNRVVYEDEVIGIQREVDRLIAKNVKIIIALGHSGFETDKRIAKDVKGVDLVIGGHTNTFLWNGQQPDVEEIQGMYPTAIKQKSGKEVPVVQAYAYTKYLGKLHLKFDKNGELVEFKGQPLLLNSLIPQDQDIIDMLEEYRPAIDNMTHAIVGRTKVVLNNDKCRLKECNLGNLIADAYIYTRASRVNYESGWTDAPIAIQQGGGLRNSIDVNTRNGNISRSETIAVLPFENVLVLATMSGEVLLKAIEWSVYNYNVLETPGAFLQYSGARVVYDLGKKPGSRVESVVLRCGNCKVPKYKPLNTTATYTVLMPSFLANGGDGYDMFQHNLISSEQVDIYDEASLVEYLEAMSPVYPAIEDRIKILNAPTSAAISHLINPYVVIISVFSIVYYNL